MKRDKSTLKWGTLAPGKELLYSGSLDFLKLVLFDYKWTNVFDLVSVENSSNFAGSLAGDLP